MAHDNPSRLVDLTADRLSHFQAKSRERGLVESTIKGDLAHLKAALRWAERVGLLVKVPKIEMPKRAKSAKMMKGRPITTEEFERMLAKVSGVVGEADAEVWKYYLNGLWRSGLRLSESLELFWDNDNKLCVDLSGKHPMLRIPGELEKGNKDRLLPLAPEFAEFLLTTPEAERTDRVFNLTTQAARAEMPSGWWVSRNVCKIGEAAGVKVSTDPRNGKVKFASAHDLRRSFGERWSTRIMPTDLMVLMRHESIETTLKFYVGRNCQRTAATLWEAHYKAAVGNTFGNTHQNATEPTFASTDETVYYHGS